MSGTRPTETRLRALVAAAREVSWLRAGMTLPVVLAFVLGYAAGGGVPLFAPAGGSTPGGTVAANQGANVTSADPPDFAAQVNVSISKSGLANVTITINRTLDAVQISKRGMGADPTITSDYGALEETDTALVWDPSVSRTVSYSVQVGQLSYGSAVLSESVLFRTKGFAPMFYWRGGEVANWTYHVDAPDGWNVAAPGKKVGTDTYATRNSKQPGESYPREVMAVGNFSVTTSTTAGGSVVRTLRLPSTDPTPSTSAVADLNTDAVPVMERTYDTETEFPRLAIVVPSTIETGGAARDHSYIVSDAQPLFDTENGQSSYVHELTHTYQTIRGPGWYSEGTASYLSHYVLREAGRVNDTEFRRMVRADVTTTNGVGRKINGSAPELKYQKGEAVFAALDMDLRNRTGGNVTIEDLLARLQATGGLSVNESAFVGALENLSGDRYDYFYYNMVERPLFPEELLGSNYSLTRPVRVDHGPPPRSVLVEQVEQQNETIQDLRAKLENASATFNVTVESANSTGAYYPDDEMTVSATSNDGAVAEVAVSYDGETKLLGDDGRTSFELADWGTQALTFSYNGTTENRSIVVGDRGAMAKLWSVDAGGRLQYSAAAAGPERVYVAGLDDTLRAVDRDDGSTVWTLQRQGSLSDSSPAYADGRVFVGSGGGVVYAVDAATGSVDWTYRTDSAVVSSPSVVGVGAAGTLFVGSNDGTVLALNASDGTVRWTAEVGAAVLSRPAVDAANDTVYLTTDDGRLVALDRTDGTTRWTYDAGVELGHSAPAVVGGDVVLAADRLYRLDGADGAMEWSTAYGGTTGSTPLVDDGTVYVGGADGSVSAVAAADGTVEWQTGTDGGVAARPTVVDGRVVVGTLNGTVHLLDAATGDRLTAVTVGAPVRSAAVVAEDVVYLGDRSATVVALGNVDGNVTL